MDIAGRGLPESVLMARQCPTLRYGNLLKIFFALQSSFAPPLDALCLDDAAWQGSRLAKNIFLTQLAQAALMDTAGRGLLGNVLMARQCPTLRYGKA
jgi:hypothetical protein